MAMAAAHPERGTNGEFIAATMRYERANNGDRSRTTNRAVCSPAIAAASGPGWTTAG